VTVLFNTMFAVLAIVTLCGIVFITRPRQVMHDIPPWGWLPLLVVMAPAQIYSQYLGWRTIFTGRTPTALEISTRQARWPAPLRPFIALVWLANFVIGFGIVVSLSKPQPGRPLAWEDVPLIAILTFWLTFAANVYLLLTIRTLTDDESAVRHISRYHVVIDVVIAGFAAVYYRL
jgi:hypothetical protein